LRYRPSRLPRTIREKLVTRRCDLPLGYAMLRAHGAPYVDPFDRICHGLRSRKAYPRNYRLKRSTRQCSKNRPGTGQVADVYTKP